MEHKFLIRYIILVSALIILAGAAWYLSQRRGTPVDAVLVERDKTPVDPVSGKWGMAKQDESGAAARKQWGEAELWQMYCI